MRSIEDKGCLSNFPTATATATEENAGSSSSIIFDFNKSSGVNNVMSRPSPHRRSSLGKPPPSKWDDAQKWLVNLSRGDKNNQANKASPRNSNADDRRLIAPAPKKEWEDEGDIETKNVECDESRWTRAGAGVCSPKSEVEVMRAICLRDMGTEMTPMGSKEPSRAATPIRRPTSPLTSRETGPSRGESDRRPPSGSTSHLSGDEIEIGSVKQVESDTKKKKKKKSDDHSRMLNPMEARAAAWEEAERAKYTARYKHEEVRIQAWENQQKKKAEMENRKVEVKAEQMKSRAKEKCRHRRAAIERIAEEKRAVAEAKLNENAMKNSEKADYIRRNGHLPSFNFPSRCCC